MGKKYKAMGYEAPVYYEGVACSITETRYRIVSTETGEVLDDAQGYGYKTAQKAYAAWGYKNRDRSKDKEKSKRTKRIKQWIKDHPSFVEEMEVCAFEIAKGSWGPDAKFDAKLVWEMLKNEGLAIDFPVVELIRVWQKG